VVITCGPVPSPLSRVFSRIDVKNMPPATSSVALAPTCT
jgi:hypothetical protein